MPSRVSVVMSVYNEQRWLKESIDSILNQSFTDFEFIIGNDGSTDNTKTILRFYKDPRLKIINFKKRLTLTYALNELLKEVKGEYIARMDADDIACPDRLKRQVDFLDIHPQVGMVGAWYVAINESGKFLREVKLPTTDLEIRRIAMRLNPICHPTMMFRRKLIDKLGPYDPKLNGAEDYDLVLRFLAVTKVVNLPDFLLKYRISSSSISLTQMDNVLKQALRVRWKAIKSYGYPKRRIADLFIPTLSSLVPAILKVKILKWIKYL